MRARLGVLFAIAITILALGLVGFTGNGPKAFKLGDPQSDQRLSDQVVKTKIEERLRMDDRIDWELLDVTVKHGHATLYGEVWTDQERGMAAMIASTVRGVEGLANSIIVEPALARDHKLTKAIWKNL